MRYANTDTPAITRRKLRGYWAYFDADGQRIKDRDEIDRLNRIGLPPAYTDTWFSANPNTHILATGIDARGRKQYAYHPDFTQQRNARKFEGCAGFARLLDSGRIRIGNEHYARENGSFGATTLRRRHVKLAGNKVSLRFKAKSGKECSFTVSDRGLIRFVKQVQDLPGQQLFKYRCDDGTYRPITSSDVNAYIHETMGEDFTAKHFRTWAASVLAFQWLVEEGGGLKAMLEYVSTQLGNTPAIARKSYIHPVLVEMAKSGDTSALPRRLPRATRWLTRYDRGLIDLLEK
ncbi:MAG: DNA topoisomerase IB [Proteobacteria bacterium]|nr:MAG: DNA topoisomerase IB [Pseudomonadota bacterium]